MKKKVDVFTMLYEGLTVSQIMDRLDYKLIDYHYTERGNKTIINYETDKFRYIIVCKKNICVKVLTEEK